MRRELRFDDPAEVVRQEGWLELQDHYWLDEEDGLLEGEERDWEETAVYPGILGSYSMEDAFLVELDAKRAMESGEWASSDSVRKRELTIAVGRERHEREEKEKKWTRKRKEKDRLEQRTRVRRDREWQEIRRRAERDQRIRGEEASRWRKEQEAFRLSQEKLAREKGPDAATEELRRRWLAVPRWQWPDHFRERIEDWERRIGGRG